MNISVLKVLVPLKEWIDILLIKLNVLFVKQSNLLLKNVLIVQLDSLDTIAKLVIYIKLIFI